MRTFYVLMTAVLLAFIPLSLQAQVTGSVAEQGLDEADLAAIAYFKSVAKDGLEHLLVWDGEAIHDISRNSVVDGVHYDPEKLDALLAEAKLLIFFHNHPGGYASPGQLYDLRPSKNDFGMITWYSYLTWRKNLGFVTQYRIVIDQEGKSSVIPYGITSGKVITATLNNASAWSMVSRERSKVAINSPEDFHFGGIIAELDLVQWVTLGPQTIGDSWFYLWTPCKKPLSTIGGIQVCPSHDYFIRLRGPVPN